MKKNKKIKIKKIKINTIFECDNQLYLIANNQSASSEKKVYKINIV
jgi:hypothetical protein